MSAIRSLMRLLKVATKIDHYLTSGESVKSGTKTASTVRLRLDDASSRIKMWADDADGDIQFSWSMI